MINLTIFYLQSGEIVLNLSCLLKRIEWTNHVIKYVVKDVHKAFHATSASKPCSYIIRSLQMRLYFTVLTSFLNLSPFCTCKCICIEDTKKRLHLAPHRGQYSFPCSRVTSVKIKALHNKLTSVNFNNNKTISFTIKSLLQHLWFHLFILSTISYG